MGLCSRKDNIVAYKNIVKEMFDNQMSKTPRAYSEKDFEEDILNQLRQNVFNQEYDLKNRASELMDVKRYKDSIGETDYDPILRREFSYRNYGSGKHNDVFEMGNIELLKNYIANDNPIFRTQATIGSGRYSIDPQGNVIVTDTYDFSKNKHMKNMADLLHLLGAYKGNAFPIKINLGNINDWNMKYTGNRDLDSYYNRYNRYLGK